MSSSESNNAQRSHKSGKNSVENEVQRLLRKGSRDGKINQHEFLRLREKYDDQDLVDKIQEAYVEKRTQIKKRAKKFARLIREKYSQSNYPYHQLLQKAHKYKQKYELSDEEFAEFQRVYERELVGQKSPELMMPTTNMSKVLGNIVQDDIGFGFRAEGKDYEHIQEIVKMYHASRSLHARVILQSMTYRDCDAEAVTGTYNRLHGHDATCHVHPVIAALFLPKIDLIDSHFLFANIAHIVKTRKERGELKTRPDYELFYSMVTDPNDIVCDSRSPVKDLLNRCQVQQHLWNSVLGLRNGQYYNCATQEFIGAVDRCRLNKYDTPDLVYGRYDGTVIKRLLASFSFRPTVVATTPYVNNMMGNTINPYAQTIRPVVTSVPMINFRLPNTLNDTAPVDLASALEQTQFFFENGQLLPKNQSLIYSRGVLIFFVDRRTHLMRVNNVLPFNVNHLPSAAAGFERMNERQVDFDTTFTIRGDKYDLRSVVVNEINDRVTINMPDAPIIVGSSTLVMLHADPTVGRFVNEYLQYDPLSAVDASRTGVTGNNPVTQIPGGPGTLPAGHSFLEKAATRGTIFIYQLTRDSSDGLITL